MNTSKNGEECQTTRFFSVYVLWNQSTSKFYVGVTRQKVSTRIRQHKRGKQFIDREIQKIGWEGNWDYWIVEENIPSNLISKCEQYWVTFFDCVYPNGYNKTCGDISKITVSEDTRKKIRKIALARDISGEKNPHYGKKHTEEAKAAQSARMKGKNNPNYGKPPANKGVSWTDEQRAKMSAAVKGEKNPFYGKHHTEEAKERNRQAHLGKPSSRKGVPCSEETKRKLREKALARGTSGEKNPFYGKHHTEKAKERNRQANLGKPAWNKGVPCSEETKARMREKALARAAAKRAAKAAQEN